MIDPVQSIYDGIPRLECRGLCQLSCGPIAYEQIEAERCGSPDIVGSGADPLRCNKLDFVGRCTVYQNRPTICRLWGVVETMKCPHGCTPERWLTHEEGYEVLRRMRALSESRQKE